MARIRVEEARVLLDKGCFSGAYYLVGYSIESALKACVAKQVRRYDFPDKKLANEAYIHNLERLVKVAGLGPAFEADLAANRDLEVNWAIVKDWTESARYEVGINEARARDLFSACTGRNGILPWIKRRW
ncbi:MAG: DNA-binding protein [Actinobacteria bacterium]|nr:MAG: DNA-binding protein [Actinomycetota bacterium]